MKSPSASAGAYEFLARDLGVEFLWHRELSVARPKSPLAPKHCSLLESSRELLGKQPSSASTRDNGVDDTLFGGFGFWGFGLAP